MKTKLTLTIEKNVVDQAKIYATGTRQSLSNIIENYLKNITENKVSELEPLYVKNPVKNKDFQIPSWLSNFAGTVNADLDPVRDKDKIRDMRIEKYIE